jgi:hypothetical protein
MTTTIPIHRVRMAGYQIENGHFVMTKNVLVRVEAKLTKNTIGGGSSPDSSLYPLGWSSGSCPTHHQRGHLVAKSLGGSGGILGNLVTLTGGTNHPFMYAIETRVKRLVVNNPKSSYMYIVKCNYDDYQDVEIAPGFTVPCAMGNPFCLFPAPSGLSISLRHWIGGGPGAFITLGELCSKFDDPEASIGPANSGATEWHIPNGGYKLNSSHRHTAQYCAATSRFDPRNNLAQRQAFLNYAKHLGYGD